MEKLWALSICNIDGFEDTMLALLGETPESSGRRSRLRSLWSDDGASESLHESWKTSRLFGALEKMLSSHSAPSLSQTPGKRPREEDGSAFSGDWGFRVDHNTPPGLDAPRVVEPSASPRFKRARLSLPTDTQTVSQPQSSGPSALQLPPQTSNLLDAYFAITHSWFPIVAKHNILRASYLYANTPLSITNVSPGSGDHAALWAILSYTISQSRAHQVDSASGPFAQTKEYYSIARNLIPAENENYGLGHVQALLLLTLVNIGLEEWTAAWLMSGKAVRMAISMELGNLTHHTQQSEELLQGKAVFLGCFVIDSLLSFRLSRRPCMHPRDLSPVGLLKEDSLEEWNSWADVLPPTGVTQSKHPPRRGPLFALSCFNRLVELASVLNKIARDCSAGPNSHAFAQQMVMELKPWDDHLSLGCRMIGPESIYPERHSALLPHQSYLGLVYMATLLWLYLRIAPQELGLHHSQRPATEGAKKLLYRALPMISQHLENFPTCGLPPVFEMSLRTIAEQAFALRTMIESDSFPFPQWTEALFKRTKELSPTWPAYVTLLTTIERWYRSSDLSEMPMDFQMDIPGPLNHRFSGDSMAMAMAGSRGMQNNSMQPAKPDLTSSILGISIPADGQYMTPKDTAMENTDLSMMHASLQQPVDGAPQFADKLAPVPDLAPAHPQPPTPESSVSNRTMAANDQSMRPPESILPNHSSNGSNEGEQPNGDIDAIFEDLAYLDTTEWTNNREAGLRDFGFIDDSTFQAFCHDPDRLVGSQPLVHPPSIADIWPPPGFFPETFQDSNDQMDT